MAGAGVWHSGGAVVHLRRLLSQQQTTLQRTSGGRFDIEQAKAGDFSWLEDILRGLHEEAILPYYITTGSGSQLMKIIPKLRLIFQKEKIRN